MVELPPEERAAVEDDLAVRLGAVPVPVANGLRSGILSGKPEEEVAAAQRIAKLARQNPALIEAIPEAERSRTRRRRFIHSSIHSSRFIHPSREAIRMFSSDIQDILQRHKSIKSGRRPWEGHWQSLAEVMHPRRADFTGAQAEGERRTERIYDGTPMLARRSLSAALDGLLKPKTSRWFRIKPGDEDLSARDDVKAWLEAAEEREFAALYNPRARFIQASGEVDDDLVTFGTGCLFIGEAPELGRLSFRSIHLRNVCPAENEAGEIDTVFIEMRLSARQAAQRYGEENLGEKTKEALKEPNAKPDEKFTFLWAVMPRAERDTRKRTNVQLPFASVVIDVDSEHTVSESGFHEFPFAIPRWDTASGELFGRSPGMIALADANTLQAQAKTLLVAGQKAVDPPLLAADDSVIGTMRTFPGGVSYFDVDVARELGRPPIIPLQTGANVPLGREMQNDTRDQIWQAFFRNVLQLPTEGPRMTATEVLERKEEFVRTIGPVFGRLEADYIARVAERAFNVMLRARAFGPMPDALQESSVRFEYASPVQQARKQIEAAGMARSFELLAPLAQVQPDIWDNFDGDAIARDTPDVFGVPQRWLRKAEERDTLRRTRAQGAQLQELLSGAGQAGSALQSLAGADEKLKGAVGDVVGNLTAAAAGTPA
ncbi:MAG: portal protein [Rhodospirillales bacterium]